MKSSVASVNRASWSRCCDRHNSSSSFPRVSHHFTSLHISISFSLSRHDMLWPDHHHQRRPLGGRPGPRPPGRFEFNFKFAALVLAALALLRNVTVQVSQSLRGAVRCHGHSRWATLTGFRCRRLEPRCATWLPSTAAATLVLSQSLPMISNHLSTATASLPCPPTPAERAGGG